MAQHYIGVNRGDNTNLQFPGIVSHGTATTGTDMELRWDDTKGITRQDLMLFTEQLEWLIESNFGGAGSVNADLP